MASMRDCKILRPVLVAVVYGEPHPERARLLAHVRKCSRCAAELEDLREVEGWIAQSATEESGEGFLAMGLRSRAGALLLKACSAAAVLLVVGMIFSGGASRRDLPANETALAKLAAADVSAAGVATTRGIEARRRHRSSGPFGVDAMDLKLESIETELLALQGDSW